jgi:hypothetical protein
MKKLKRAKLYKPYKGGGSSGLGEVRMTANYFHD